MHYIDQNITNTEISDGNATACISIYPYKPLPSDTNLYVWTEIGGSNVTRVCVTF